MKFNMNQKTQITIWLIVLCFHFEVDIKSQPWFVNSQEADLMISGVGFNQSGGPITFNHPSGLATDGQRLLVCDRFNNRILIWNQAPENWNVKPDLVLGQQNFDSNNPGSGKCQLNWPGNASLAENGKLVIADTDNDRLLIWHNFPSSNGSCADVSIHLPSISPPGLPLRWAWPWGVWTDGKKLAAVATMGSSLLFWNQIPTTDNTSPDYVISDSKFGTPRNISSDGSTYFFVGDHNAKVNGIPGTFFWNTYPTQPNQSFDFYQDEWVKGSLLKSGKISTSGLMSIYFWDSIPRYSTDKPSYAISPPYYLNGDGVDILECNDKIYVCNYNGNNILVYNKIPDSLHKDADFAIGISNYNNNSLDSIGYIQNPVLTTDGNRLLVSSDFNHKIYVYNKFPDQSGVFADEEISLQTYNLFPWDAALYKNIYVIAGKSSIAIWLNSNKLYTAPDIIFNNQIGTAKWNDIKGVALDSTYFYVADRNGNLFIWEGIPKNKSVNPLYSINFGNVELNRLSSDGEYLCVTQQSPAAIFIYQVSDLKKGILTPWKTISGIGFLNLPSEAATYHGSLAIANMSFHDVLLWKDIQDAPDPDKMIVLGNQKNSPSNIPQIGSRNLFMPGSLLFNNNQLWVGEHKFSSRILRYSYQTSGIDGTAKNATVDYTVNAHNRSIVINFSDELKNKFYSITNLNGQEVWRSSLDHSPHIVASDQFPNGIYFLRIDNKIAFEFNIFEN